MGYSYSNIYTRNQAFLHISINVYTVSVTDMYSLYSNLLPWRKNTSVPQGKEKSSQAIEHLHHGDEVTEWLPKMISFTPWWCQYCLDDGVHFLDAPATSHQQRNGLHNSWTL